MIFERPKYGRIVEDGSVGQDEKTCSFKEEDYKYIRPGIQTRACGEGREGNNIYPCSVL